MIQADKWYLITITPEKDAITSVGIRPFQNKEDVSYSAYRTQVSDGFVGIVNGQYLIKNGVADGAAPHLS